MYELIIPDGGIETVHGTIAPNGGTLSLKAGKGVKKITSVGFDYEGGLSVMVEWVTVNGEEKMGCFFTPDVVHSNLAEGHATAVLRVQESIPGMEWVERYEIVPE